MANNQPGCNKNHTKTALGHEKHVEKHRYTATIPKRWKNNTLKANKKETSQVSAKLRTQ
jgi:hypothetical protein